MLKGDIPRQFQLSRKLRKTHSCQDRQLVFEIQSTARNPSNGDAHAEAGRLARTGPLARQFREVPPAPGVVARIGSSRGTIIPEQEVTMNILQRLEVFNFHLRKIKLDLKFVVQLNGRYMGLG
jgi:hypothetical protein